MKALLLLSFSFAFLFGIFGQTILPDRHIYPSVFDTPPNDWHQFNTENGYIRLGPANTSGAHIYTDRNVFFFNKNIRNIGGHYGSYQNDIKLGPHTHEVLTISYSNNNTGLRISNPAHDLHVHGVDNYVTGGAATSSFGGGSNQGYGSISSSENESIGGADSLGGGFSSTMHGGTYGGTTNFGKAACIGLTNTNTGQGKEHGGLLMQADDDMYIWNRENGKLRLEAPGISFELSGVENRIFSGLPASGHSRYGRMTIQSSFDNGLFVRATSSSKSAIIAAANGDQSTFISYANTDLSAPTFSVTGYGLVTASQMVSRSTDDQNIALQCFGTDNQQPNFMVYGSGNVKARRIVVNQQQWADYVFKEDYMLMPLPQVKEYINTHGHLPNVPAAEEIEEKGVDLGEMNKILLEKIEELTLYTIEQQKELEELKVKLDQLVKKQ